MIRETNENELINRYLLGELSEDELARVEERYFADEDFFAQLLEAENSLVDSYVWGNFSAAEKNKFERLFLTTPQRRQKVRFAQSLDKAITESQTNVATDVIALKKQPDADNGKISLLKWLAGIFNVQSPALAFGTAAILLMIAGVAFLAVLQRGNRSLEIARQESPSNQPIINSQQPNIGANTVDNNQSAQVNPSPRKPVNAPSENISPQQKPQNEKQARDTSVRPEKQPDNANSSSEKAEKSNPPQPQPVIATFLLSPGLVRGEGARNQITIPAKQNQIRLQLNLEENEYARYVAEIENPDGEKVWSARVPKAKKGVKTINLLVPARSLSKGDYRLILKGETAEGETETVSEYPFSVVKK